MNRRNSSDFVRFSLLSKQLVDEVHDAQVALAVAEHCIGSCSQKMASYDMYHFYAAHEALHEAGKTIDRVIELLRAAAARSLQDSG